MKIQSQTFYIAEDGDKFDSAEKCTAHENLVERIRKIMEPLKIPDDAAEKVSNHAGHWQHDIETVYAAREDILSICREQQKVAGNENLYPAFKHHGREVHPLSVVGRILDDIGGPLNDAWRRFAMIDPAGREWQQCFYAYTAGESERVGIPCLNPSTATHVAV